MAKTVGSRARGFAQTMEPTPERLGQDEVTVEVGRDEAGWPVRRYFVADMIARLVRTGMLEDAWADAVTRFRRDYRRAHYQPLGVRDLHRLKGDPQTAPLDDQVEDARQRVSRALSRLGGVGSPLGSIAWDVIGRELSVAAWCERQRRSFGRAFRHDMAAGLLIGAAGALAAHYAAQARMAEPRPRR